MTKTQPKIAIKFYQGVKDLTSNFKDEEQLIEGIKEKMNDFFNMKNICFLFGSGTSSGSIPTMKELVTKAKNEITSLSKTHVAFYESITLKDPDNLEELLGILYSSKIYFSSDASKGGELQICTEVIEVIERVIYTEINIDFNDSKHEAQLNNYKNFYHKVGFRNKDLSRISIFTTNNDMFNEYALDSLNISYINGFGGGINRFFNPAYFNYTFSKRMDTSIDKYEPIENLVYLYKIHGSVNWLEDISNANTFFNIREETSLKNLVYDSSNNVLIYPTPTKQNKSLGSPYTELFREFQKKLLEPNTVIFVIGYSFSDEHVNNIIYQSLATNSTINVVIFNDLSSKEISKINDNRIFKIYGYDSTGAKIHYFNNIIDKFIPDINMHNNEIELLRKYITENKKP
ncbi:hypothetical protein GCM10008015_29980 [Flavobacterium palustre]|uniref:SIR2-like domain-containing protein n=1 Tax=Flavobacterium palustre TaxID=1476463 RepID=A0ABQ1HSR6_9FLAO|nr:SIR2 family protein [Flavobacterium palustre]GGA87320.1 hypothetical protein GCM10008015_29980 [Flavobacterium palustre]